jgi:hypothetical protein
MGATSGRDNQTKFEMFLWYGDQVIVAQYLVNKSYHKLLTEIFNKSILH